MAVTLAKVPYRRHPAPRFLALGAFVAGLIGVVSALTPETASRFAAVRGVLPPGVPEAARVVALAFGLSLLWLARGLARRKHRAWVLAVGVVAGSAAAHLAKGLDVEEASATFVLLVALWRYRRHFDAPGDPETLRPLVRVLLALGAVIGLSVLRWDDGVAFSDRITDALALIAIALLFRALILWLRPLRGRGGQTSDERVLAERLVQEQGHDSLSYFALRRDKSYFFSTTSRTFLAYRVVNGSALVSGDPIGRPDEVEPLLSEFRRVAHVSGWRVGVLGASEELLPMYRRAGFKAVYLGDEAVVDPQTFSLDGRAIRKVRQSVSRLHKAGYTARALPVSAVDDALRCEIATVSSEWLGHAPERGFSMAMDALWDYPDSMLVLAESPDGSLGGFLHLVPAPASGGYSLATMRRRDETPNGLMEFLIVETIGWAREQQTHELSLNFAVFADVLRADESSKWRKRALRFALLRFDRFFQLDRLFSFNRKFYPEWRRRYICFERYADLPLVAFAFMHVEQLLTPPGPWVRSSDVAAA